MNRIAQTKNGLIEYRVVGQGPAVLLLNGGHTNCNSPFGHEQFFLDQGCRLVIPSRPGYGKTPSATGKTAEAFADALVDLLNHLRLERAIVVGISAAGPTALQLAGRHPERVSKLILQNAVTGGRFPTLGTRLGAYLLFNPWVEGWIWAAFRAFARFAPLSALKSMMGSLSSLDPAQVVATMSREQQQAALAFLLASRSGSGFLHDLQHHCGDLQRISAPTLIIESKYDGSVDASHATYAADHIANAELFVSPAESHLLWFSSYNAAIEEKMRAFLTA
ncbi:MAG TPA: alpha/beta hydrolase [Chloroflexia bacterium]|nr:alpha/beta hydrolase [Chloroflexia bacterium]